MGGFIKFAPNEAEDIKYLVPSGFLRMVNGVDDLWNVSDLDVLMRVVGAEAGSQGRERQEALASSILNRSGGSVTGYFSGIKGVVLEPGAFRSVTWASLPDEYLEEEYARRTKRRILDPRSNYKPWELKQVIDFVGSEYFRREEANNAESYGINVREGLHDRLFEVSSGNDYKYQKENVARKAKYYPYAVGVWDGDISFSVRLGQAVRIIVTNENILGTTIAIDSNYWSETQGLIGLLPRQEHVFRFFVGGAEPVPWTFNVRTNSEAFVVLYKIESTWVPGVSPNR